MSRNVAYTSQEIARFYGSHRRRWDEFYPSERWGFERAAQGRKSLGRVLDVGCAAGGLGEALASSFSLDEYVGVDISSAAIAYANERVASFPVKAEFHADDICDCAPLRGRQFDFVTGLSVVDWNTDPTGILAAIWSHVAPGGRMLLSLRLTPQESISDIKRSYQYIWFGNDTPPPDTEIAQYTVLNIPDALSMLASQKPAPSDILAYGYWGKPSAAARTPFERILFSVILVTKTETGAVSGEPRVEAHWPVGAFKR